MHIKSLKIFCDIVSRRSFSKAADDNGISQSNASQIVQHLEEALGVRLLDRSKRPFDLTPEGDVFYNGCRKLVPRIRALEEEVKTLHEEVSGRASVASIYSVGLSHLSHYVKDFLSQNPKANLKIEYQHPAKVLELVENDEIDLGLVSYPKSSRTLKATVWREEPMVVVCAPGHAFADLDSVSNQDLRGQDLVSFDTDLRIRREIDRALTSHQIETRVAMEFDNIETIKRAVEIDAGISLLPAPSIDRELQLGTLIARPLRDFQLTRPIGLLTRRGRVLGPTAKRLIQLLRSDELEAAEKPAELGTSIGSPDDRAAVSASLATTTQSVEASTTEALDLASSAVSDEAGE